MDITRRITCGLAVAAAASATLLLGAPAEAQLLQTTTQGRYGVQLMVGGGVQDFALTPTRSVSDVGGQWEAAVAFRPSMLPMAIEAAYVGAAQSIFPDGFSSTLFSHTIEGVLKIQPSLGAVNWVEPFVLGGAGFTAYSSDRRTSSGQGELVINDPTDVTLTVPLGGGLQFRYMGLILDFRGVYRLRFDKDLFTRTSTGEGANLDTWSVTGRIGIDL